MPAQKLKSFLDGHGIKYVSLAHSPTYTAQEVAASTHVTGKHFAKTVIVKIDGEMAMAVLPSHRKIVLHDLREITGCDNVRFASEEEFKSVFPDCEVGAMPPFGNLYGLEVFVAPELAHSEEIAFNAGTHTEVITLAYRDFEQLVQPRVLNFTN
ncbi:MAG: YbaK/EbsC family protein [Verrucomicrobiota bacterium]